MPGRHGSSASYRYGFNGKELDNELKGEGNSYDFGARLLDPRVGRWFTPDPLEREGPEYSTYNYAFNNPVNFIDPDGQWPDLPSWSSVKSSIKKTIQYDKIRRDVRNIKNELFSSKWSRSNTFKPVAKLKIVPSVGLQVGVKGTTSLATGKVEAGAFVVSPGSLTLSLDGVKTEEDEGKVHDYIGGEVDVPLAKTFGIKQLTVGGKLDYSYKSKDLLNKEKGSEIIDAEVSLVTLKFTPLAKLIPGRIEVTPKVKAKAGTQFIGIDLGASLKVLIGIEANLKVGYEVKPK